MKMSCSRLHGTGLGLTRLMKTDGHMYRKAGTAWAMCAGGDTPVAWKPNQRRQQYCKQLNKEAGLASLGRSLWGSCS